MITPSQLTRHIKTYLPIFTDKFTQSLTVDSASVSILNVLTVSSVAHGLSVGDEIVLTGGFVRNPLSASALEGTTQVKFTTKYDNDQTQPQLPKDQQTLELAGFTGGDTVWNGEHTIIGIPNRRNFIIDLPAGETVAPTVDESQYLIESVFKGVYTVATTPDADTLTIDLSDNPTLPPGTVDSLGIIIGFNICACADFDRAVAIYTAQQAPSAYLFVIMTDGDVSKDRHTFSDALANFTAGDEARLDALRNFSTVVFFPTDDDTSGVDAQDLAYDSVYSALLATLFGYRDNDDSAIQFMAVPKGDGPARYNTAYYAHGYDWQMPTVLTFENGFLQDNNVAFRDIAATFKLFNDAQAEMSVNINLDDEPLS